MGSRSFCFVALAITWSYGHGYLPAHRLVLCVCCIFLLLMYVIFSCFVENTLIIACSIQIKDISLYQQFKQKHYDT